MFYRYRDMADRLREREWADRWAFLLFAIGGSVLIWGSKGLGVDPIYVALGAMIVMLGYAALVNLGPKLKLRADQLGDNCYYLGLVFTLASLSYAIFTFDPANTATTIVQGFGVALVSTVLGLVLRVFFSQGQPDLAMAEDNARIALTQTAAAVRAELDGVLLSFQTFAVQTQQHLVELRDQVRGDYESVGATVRTTIDEAADTVRTTLAEQAAETNGEMRKVTRSMGKLVSAIEGHAATLGSITERTSAQLEGLTAIENAGLAAAAALVQVSGGAETMQRSQAGLAENVDRVAATAATMGETVAAMKAAAERFDTLVEARLATLGEAPLKLGDGLDRALADALARWQETISGHNKSHAQALRDFETARVTELQTSVRHNEALAVELGRSREMVGKVHGALVEMTDQLTARVAAAAER